MIYLYAPVRRHPDGSERYEVWELRSSEDAARECVEAAGATNGAWHDAHPVIRIGKFYTTEVAPD